NGITSQLTAPGTPQQNGVAERRNRTLLEMVRSMMSYASLATSFWGYALETAAYLLNFVPSKSILNSPIELWSGRKPSFNHIRIWGCPAHVLDKEADKLAPRTEVQLFVGYPKGKRGGYFFSPKDQRVVVSTNARFLEEDYMSENKSKGEIILNELAEDNSIPSVQVDIPQETTQRVHSNVFTPKLPRRSERVVRHPDHFMFVGESSDFIPSDEHDSDPWTYNEEIQDVDAESWQKSMDSEIESIDVMDVYDLRDLPEGKKAIRVFSTYQISPRLKRCLSSSIKSNPLSQLIIIIYHSMPNQNIKQASAHKSNLSPHQPTNEKYTQQPRNLNTWKSTLLTRFTVSLKVYRLNVKWYSRLVASRYLQEKCQNQCSGTARVVLVYEIIEGDVAGNSHHGSGQAAGKTSSRTSSLGDRAVISRLFISINYVFSSDIIFGNNYFQLFQSKLPETIFD
ncbi:Uncharacterized mitochondrial protein AtMg00710, partial [Striga hermonthica]